MPIETRKRRGAYYTVSLRNGGKPLRLYFGKTDSAPAELAQVMMGIYKIDVELAHRNIARGTIHRRNSYLKKEPPPVSKPVIPHANVDAMWKFVQESFNPGPPKGRLPSAKADGDSTIHPPADAGDFRTGDPGFTTQLPTHPSDPLLPNDEKPGV